ncbi:MAG: hypothetical protein DI628_07905 [Blastochloris viridis]|uniref:Uncharacterized protein n=1 Tax=Blastochloris viridis TaxID=1079 RepID=A0A6N4R026_BLAVI|nr:MAG: hypothetical protein DI628_07905 [Blastochloris viridis]
MNVFSRFRKITETGPPSMIVNPLMKAEQAVTRQRLERLTDDERRLINDALDMLTWEELETLIPESNLNPTSKARIDMENTVFYLQDKDDDAARTTIRLLQQLGLHTATFKRPDFRFEGRKV